MSSDSALAAHLHTFFQEYLTVQRNVSQHTLFAYRDAIKLLLRFAAGRRRKPVASCFHARSCRNTRMVFMPRSSAHFNSVAIQIGSKVSCCHISSSLIAVAGM